MDISFSHIRLGSASVAVFETDARNHSQRGQLLAELTAEARANNLRIDRAALAFVEHGRLTFFGDPDLVKALAKGGVFLPRNYRLSR